MAFLAEDGTGLTASNGYVDVAFVDEYHTDRGATSWLFSDAAGTVAVTTVQKQRAIVRASDHIDRVFGNFFRGYKSTDAQSMHWPRSGAWGPDGYPLIGVPEALKRACAEYAVRALAYGVLTPDTPPKGPRQTLEQGSDIAVYGEGEGEILSVREKVGPLETETRYNQATSGSLAQHAAADMLLRPLLRTKSNDIVRG